jgi:ketosteroid isomerase-like protein
MKKILLLSIIIFSYTNIFAQNNLQKIYDTEKAFEKAAAEKGLNQSFIEYAAPDGTCFFPGYPVNCREYFKTQPPSPAALFWNPTFIDVSSNGAMAYSTGNSIYKPQGKDDKNAFYGEYATVWQKQPDGNYRAVLDLGISHDQANNETKWISPPDTGKELNEKKFSAADASTAFFEMTTKQGLGKAYKSFLAEDARILREGKMPIIGKQNALGEYKNFKSSVNFAKRSIFVGAADMAYISNSYTITDKLGKQLEKGNFLQVWKLRGNKWQIVFDIFVPSPAEKK